MSLGKIMVHGCKGVRIRDLGPSFKGPCNSRLHQLQIKRMSRIKVQLLVRAFSMVSDFLRSIENETICVSQPLQHGNDKDRQPSRCCKKKYSTKKKTFTYFETIIIESWLEILHGNCRSFGTLNCGWIVNCSWLAVENYIVAWRPELPSLKKTHLRT